MVRFPRPLPESRARQSLRVLTAGNTAPGRAGDLMTAAQPDDRHLQVSVNAAVS